MKSRILIVFVFLLSVWGALIFRAFYLQVLPNERLSNLQEKQFQTVITLQSRRGAIVDRKGRDLALSSTAFSVFADPKIIESKKQVARKLSKILGLSYESIYAKIKDKNKRFVWIDRLVSKEKADEIKDLDFYGISMVEEFKRVYPNENLLSNTLGFIGSEGHGLEGLELSYDEKLGGSKKKISVQRDARGRPLLDSGLLFTENPDGAEIKLTIDSEMQHLLENELQNAVSEFDADQAFGVILDASTSAILAMVNTPTFDANRATKVSSAIRRNRVVSDTFEPGSTMKTFAIATALQEKIVAPNKKYNTENGLFKVGDRIIREAESTHKWSQLSVSEILAYSSNIGTTKIAFEMGAENLRNGLVNFGFGSKTGVDLPGEAKGTLHALPWNQHLLSNVSFGQGIAVTPLQVANAYAAIANGGVLNTPYLVESIKDPETGAVTEMKPKPIRRVLSQDVASSMKLMLMGVTAEGGTGVNANVDGFLVSGKTGTAQKVNPNGRGYLPNGYISSFAGFLPANDPKFVIYIVVDHPKKSSYYGSVVAAPVFSRVASYAARLEGVAPLLISEKNAPSLKKLKLSKNKKNQIKTDNNQKSNLIEARMPSAVKIDISHLAEQKSKTEIKMMPELKKLSAREVIQKLSGHEFQIKFIGSGVVAQTLPEAGSELLEQSSITVYLENQ